MLTHMSNSILHYRELHSSDISMHGQHLNLYQGGSQCKRLSGLQGTAWHCVLSR